MKHALRADMLCRLAKLDGQDAKLRSLAIAERLAGLASFQTAEVVMLYLPMAGEVQTLGIAQRAWAAGRRVVCPTACDRCHGMRTILCPPETAEVFDPAQGLRQPDRRLGELPVEQIDLIVVPAVAFDRKCNRLGRGGGFYDRFLARPEVRAATAGVAFAEQILPELPIGPNDRPVDAVCTDHECLTRLEGAD